MRFSASKKAVQKLTVYALWLGFAVLFFFIGQAFKEPYAVFVQNNDCEVRLQLMKTAISRLGVCEPEEATVVWADGLVKRSAALQYAVLSAELKQEYEKQLKSTAPNWVTGMSSPWISGYEITDVQRPDDKTSVIKLVFTSVTSAGPYMKYNTKLKLSLEDGFWRIIGIDADPELYPYTRLNFNE